jgi:hypothetical protein
LQAMLIVGGPHVKNLDPNGRIRFLHILQQVRPDCKTRNQFYGKTMIEHPFLRLRNYPHAGGTRPLAGRVGAPCG